MPTPSPLGMPVDSHAPLRLRMTEDQDGTLVALLIKNESITLEGFDEGLSRYTLDLIKDILGVGRHFSQCECYATAALRAAICALGRI